MVLLVIVLCLVLLWRSTVAGLQRKEGLLVEDMTEQVGRVDWTVSAPIHFPIAPSRV
jgi:hypothetical protein